MLLGAIAITACVSNGGTAASSNNISVVQTVAINAPTS
tara:strand:- start:446 stop:559 length:114 start_codon:yes stop_codon:yes gene_type:complete